MERALLRQTIFEWLAILVASVLAISCDRGSGSPQVPPTDGMTAEPTAPQIREPNARSSQATRLGRYLNESDLLLNALAKRFDEAALRVVALEQELSKMPNADPFMAERQSKFRAMGEEMERAKGDVEILRKQVEALRVPQEGEAYHNRVLVLMRGVEDYFPAQKKFYEDSVAFWTEKRDTGAWAAYSLQLRRTDELREQLKKEIYGIERGRRELAEQFGLPSPAARSGRPHSSSTIRTNSSMPAST